MKNLYTPVLCLCATLYSFCSLAQDTKVPINEPNYNKPKLFNDLPDHISVSAEKLNTLLTNPVGRSINTRLSDNSDNAGLPFEGEVVSVASKYENTIQSVVIRCTNYNGATLTFSRITHPDGTITYSGRLMSFQHGDLYELQTKDGNLLFVKKNFYDVVNE